MILLIASALCFVLAFYIPYLWGMIFLFPLLFLWETTQPTWTVFHPIVWSIIAMGLHSSVIIESLTRFPSFSLTSLLTCGFLLIGYLTTCCSSILIISHFMIQKLHPSPLIHLIIWAFSCAVLFWILIYYGLFPCGLSTGYPVIDPLIPLANNSYFLKPLCDFPHFFSLLLFFYTPAVFLIFFTQKNSCPLLFSLAFIMGLIYLQDYPKPSTLYSTAPIIWMPYEFPDYPFSYITQEVQRLINEKLATQPDALIVIFPESAFQVDFSRHTIITQWTEQQLHKKVTIILGGIRNEDKKQYNCMYWIDNGEIKGWFDKKLPVPLVETDITFCGCTAISCSSFREHTITIGLNKRPNWRINFDQYTPYICSDLFLTPFEAPRNNSNILLALCHDIYCSASLRYYMQLMAQYKAIFWNCPILYVGYINCQWFFP